jgi:hypothetical protein
MSKHTLTLMGGPHDELRVSAEVLHQAVGALLEGARRAARFAVEGESVRKGPRPSWLNDACSLDITGMSPGSVELQVEMPTFQEAHAARAGKDGQQHLADAIDRGFGGKTAVDLFGDTLAEVIEGASDNVRADRPLLDICARFAGVSAGVYEGVQLDGLTGRDSSVTITPDHAQMITGLRDQTPPPQAARVVGTLDTISASIADVTLVLTDASRISIRLEEHDPELLEALFRKRVVVSGLASYSPSGLLLLLNGESIREAGDGDILFETAPVAQRCMPSTTPVAQDDSSGVSAFLGIWPGDESDDELLESLEALG